MSVILISLKAGGVALNLTVASHIYLMDPWWNPAAEYQVALTRTLIRTCTRTLRTCTRTRTLIALPSPPPPP